MRVTKKMSEAKEVVDKTDREIELIQRPDKAVKAGHVITFIIDRESHCVRSTCNSVPLH